MNREQWLNNAMSAFALIVNGNSSNQLPMDKIKVSCSLTTGRKKKPSETINAKNSADGTWNILISPTIADPIEVSKQLAIQLVNIATADTNTDFLRICNALAFENTIPDTQFAITFGELIAELGDYPHAEVSLPETTKQSTRLISASCPKCGMKIWLTQKWIKQGLPICSIDAESFRIVL